MVEILVTGGTFDKEYNFVSGELNFYETHIPAMLERGRCSIDVGVRTLFMLDSREITEEMRGEIYQAILTSESERIVVTHGTDTMVDTALYLKGRGLGSRTVILTGAMIPYAFGTSSDGFFNLGSAISFCQILPPGVYVCMNGRYFEADNVKKNYTTGFFEELG